MATEQHKPSALADFKLDFEQVGAERQISAFALRKLAKEQKRANRGPSIISLVVQVYSEVLFA